VSVQKCPGQNRRFWTPEDINEISCPVCGGPVELWKDQGITKCPKCGFSIRNPKVELGCAQWCRFAAECIGERSEDADQDMSVRERLLSVMRERFANDRERLYHTLGVLEWAERLLPFEGGSPIVVKAAVILHDLEEYSGEHSEQQVLKILSDLGIGENVSMEVCEVISRYHRGEEIESQEFHVFRDAHILSEISEVSDMPPSEQRREPLRRRLRTESAKRFSTKRVSTKRVSKDAG